MRILQAINAPKISFAEPDVLLVDKHMAEELIASLRDKGHNTRSSKIGNAHGIRILYDNKGEITELETGVDKRREMQ